MSTSTTVSVAPSGMFGALRIRNFRIFMIGQLISHTGGWAQRIAQDWLVLTLTGSATAVGITTALQFLPTLLFGFVGGVVADRYPKRAVLLVTQSSMAICAATLAALTISGVVQPWHIFALATVLGTAAAIDNPTRQAFTGELVGRHHLRNAISLSAAVFHLGALGGPAVATVLISLVGIGYSFAVNAVSSLATITALCLIRSESLRTSLDHQATCGETQRIPAMIAGQPRMLWATVLAGVFAVFTVNLPVTLASMSATVLSTGAAGYGFLACMLALGSINGALLCARRTPTRLSGLIGAAAALTVVQFLAAVSPDRWTIGVALIAVGAASTLLGISANAIVQNAAPENTRGRVMGIYLLVVIGSAAMGGPLMGLINEEFGPRMALLIGGFVPGAVVLVLTVHLSRSAPLRAQAWVRSRRLWLTEQITNGPVHRSAQRLRLRKGFQGN